MTTNERAQEIVDSCLCAEPPYKYCEESARLHYNDLISNIASALSAPETDEQITHDEVVQAITDMQEGRESHVQWAAHLRNTKRHDCQGCADHAAHIGEARYHDEWIEKYDRVIRLLARVPYRATPSGP